jgi:hypothetical protein
MGLEMNEEFGVEMDKRFTYHAPKGDQPERYVSLRNKARELAEMIVSLCPESRERSLALTKVEESVFWANASIARRE